MTIAIHTKIKFAKFGLEENGTLTVSSGRLNIAIGEYTIASFDLPTVCDLLEDSMSPKSKNPIIARRAKQLRNIPYKVR